MQTGLFVFIYPEWMWQHRCLLQLARTHNCMCVRLSAKDATVNFIGCVISALLFRDRAAQERFRGQETEGLLRVWQ